MLLELVILLTSAVCGFPVWGLCHAEVGNALPLVCRGISLCDDQSLKFFEQKKDHELVGDKPQARVKQKHVIVVFIHGTLFPLPSFTVFQEWAVNCWKDGEKTSYVDLLRDKGILRHQPLGPLGLHPVEPKLSFSANGAQLLAACLQEMYTLLPLGEYESIHPYTFGWDGALSLDHRKEESRKLLVGLRSLIEKYRKLYPADQVRVQILAHSHGGNVALHMVDWIDEKISFTVSELLLFGTPIHGETSHHVDASFFEQVYNFHSSGDFIQIADIVSTKKYQPARVFKQDSIITSPKVKQILVEVGSYNPNHSELWFFRRPEIFFFREALPSAPLPVVAFSPLLLREIKKSLSHEHFLKLSINPNGGDICIRVTPFSDYWKNELVRFHSYESLINFQPFSRQLSLIKKE